MNGNLFSPAKIISLVIVALAIGATFIWLLPVGAASIDLKRYQEVIAILQHGENPYKESHYLNYAPAWMQVLWLIGLVAGKDQQVQELLLKSVNLFSICALVLCTTLAIGRFRSHTSAVSAVLIGLVLNPLVLLVAYVHGSFDPLLALIVTSSLALLTEAQFRKCSTTWLAGAFLLGIGILLKSVPLIYVPLLFVPQAWISWRTRVFGLMLSFTPFLLAFSVLYALAPQESSANILSYASVPGYFGITGIIQALGFGANFTHYYQHAFKFLLFAALVCSSLAFWSRKVSAAPSSNYHFALLATLALLVFGPGFGTQYLVWLAPLAVLRWASSPSERQLSKLPLLATFVVANVTLLYEYARFPILSGTLAVDIFSSQALSMEAKAATIERLPLFICLLCWFLSEARSLVRG